MSLMRKAWPGVVLLGLVGAGCGEGSTAEPLSSTSTAPPVANSEYCPKSAPALGRKSEGKNTADACGIPVDTAGQRTKQELTRSSTVKEYSGSGPVNLSCFDKASWPQPQSSQVVDMVGYVRNFSNGCDVIGAKVEVFKVKRTGGADDGELGELVGTAVEIADAPCTDATPDVCKLLVVQGKCSEDNPRKLRKYIYKGLPTETELLIKSSSGSANPTGYATLFDYNIYIPNSEVQNGTWERDVRAIVTSDYTTIPQVTLGRTITSGNGAVAGEVHDCDNVRVSNANVDISAERAGVAYFTDNEDAPLPDPGGVSTSTLGLYSALDVPPGITRVSAVGVLGGKTVGLGYYDVRVFPNAITSMTFRGFRPHQVAAAGK